MSRRLNLNSSTIINPERKTLLVRDFSGVDLTSPRNAVGDGKGIYSMNYVMRDGKARKRHGYEQIAKAPSDFVRLKRFDGTNDPSSSLRNSPRINGMWHLIGEDGKEHTVAHIGRLLYEVKGISSRPTFSLLGATSLSGATYCYWFLDQRSYATVGQNRLWFLGGNRYMVVRFLAGGATVEPVSDSSVTYIPTTTIGITYTDAITGKRSGLDYPNLMSKFRRNMLLSGVGKKEKPTTQYYEYTLDAPIVCESEGDMGKAYEKIRIRGEVIENAD